MPCPVCRSHNIYASRRRKLERGPLTWIGILPYRCSECRARFYRISINDPRRHQQKMDFESPVDKPRNPRLTTKENAVVTVDIPEHPGVTLNGTMENVSLEGARLLLPMALSEDTQAKITFEEGQSWLAVIRWVHAQGKSGFLHGVHFKTPLNKHGTYTLLLSQIKFRKAFRRGIIVLIGAFIIAAALYKLVQFAEIFDTYNPKYYEPKDLDREHKELQHRLDSLKKLK